MQENPLLEAALQYAARGWRVFPLHNPVGQACSCGRDCGRDAGKHPRTARGVHDATTDAAKITRWWTRWPAANIGLATGHGLLVVDLDSAAQWQQLQAIAKQDIATLAATTGRGGHLYFDDQAGSGGSKTIEGVLIRREGGYVVAPPSLHANGKCYQWVSHAALSAVPPWLSQWLEAAGSTSVTTSSVEALLGPRPQHLQAVTAKRASVGVQEPWSPHEEARIRGALAAIPASCGREPWLAVGMALHSLGWRQEGSGGAPGRDAGLEMWDAWSATCPEKYTPFDVETRWRSFGKRNGVGLGTLFKLAADRGWVGQVAAVRTTAYEVNGVHALPAALAQPPAIVFPDTDRFGNPRPTCTNTRVAIAALGVACEHDTFHERLRLGGHAIAQWAGEFSDNVVQMLRVVVHERFGFDPGTQSAQDAAFQECLQHHYDPVQDYLDNLQWDGKARIGSWLADYLGADRTVLNMHIGALTLIAAVRRVRKPGAKFDQITVLEGPEGRGKSSVIEILAGSENFSDQTLLSLNDRQQQEALAGVWLYEIADLAGMSKTEVEKVKAFASRNADRARPAYGRNRVDRARRCIFIATTNLDTYLKSQTGNRRFWPVRTERIRLEELRRDRDQLWAEASALEAKGTSLVLDERLWEEAGRVQDARRDHDPWDDTLAQLEGTYHEGSGEHRVASATILRLALDLPAERQTEVAAKRLAFVMRRLGWDGPKNIKFEGVVLRGYSRQKVAATAVV